MRRIFLLFILSLVLLMTSCATLFTGTSDYLTFNTNPQGAMVYIDGVEQCVTPCQLKVKRSLNEADVEFRLDGYEARIITLSTEFNVVSVLNLGNVLGWAIDAVSGSVLKYDRKIYDIQLNEVLASTKAQRININTKEKIAEIYVVEK